jgi:hypothetical protein
MMDFMTKQMQEVESPTGSQVQVPAVKETKKQEVAVQEPKKEENPFGDVVSNFLAGGAPSDPKEGAPIAEEEKAPVADPNEKSLAEILKSCKDENDFVSKVLSRKDGLNHLLLSDVNHLM